MIKSLGPRSYTTTDPTEYVSRESEIVASAVTLLILPTFAVALRLLSRWMSKAGLWWDDYAAILAMMFSWGTNIVNLAAIHSGFGQHSDMIPTSSVYGWFKYLYSFEFLYELSMLTVKLSIVSFLYRIFPIIQFRRILIGLHALFVAIAIACITVSVFQCVPIHQFWDVLPGSIPGQTPVGNCIDIGLFFIVTGAINAIFDFVILALPIPLLWRLRAGRTQKFILLGIFTLGLTVCAVSVVRLIFVSKLGASGDVTWNYVTPSIWTAAEPSTAVICACLPSFRPLFVRIVWGGSYRPDRGPTTHKRKAGSLASSSVWRSAARGKDHHNDGSFNRLNEEGAQVPPWRRNNNVTVYSGRQSSSEEYDIGNGSAEEQKLPMQGIRVKTTVVQTISDRVDWQDDLF